MTGQFYGGTSVLKIGIPKRDFPFEHADKSRLDFYAHHENSIEINSTFYKLPRAKTIRKWTTEVPINFQFTFKLWKEITIRKIFYSTTQTSIVRSLFVKKIFRFFHHFFQINTFTQHAFKQVPLHA